MVFMGVWYGHLRILSFGLPYKKDIDDYKAVLVILLLSSGAGAGV